MSADLKEKIETALKFHKAGDMKQAEKLYKEILDTSPNNGNALNLLGFLKISNNEFQEAVEYLKKAAVLHPNFFDAWFNLGLAYKNENMLDEAIEAYNQALKIAPESYEVNYNIAGVYERKNETKTAVEYYRKALEYCKNEHRAEIHYLLGILSMKIKDFENGLKHYEYRLSRDFATVTQTLQYKDLFTSKPPWQGEDISDKTLFVYYEAGLGDTLMYLRYLSLLKGKCKKILFRPQVCFYEFFKENNFGVDIVDSKFPIEEVGFDTHVSLMSIPYVLNLATDKVPLTGGYLKANSQKIQEYKEKYFNNNKFKIGIKWKGNTSYDVTRVIQIENFYKLFELPNTQFYSLQVGDGIEELKKAPSHIINLGETFKDFGNTAAAVENCDLIICNDTSVAHLAGAMGKKCFVLLPFVQNWRWSTDTSYCYWYDCVRLFKQSQADVWDDVFEEVLLGLIQQKF